MKNQFLNLLVKNLYALLWILVFSYFLQAQVNPNEDHLTVCVTDGDGRFVTDLTTQNMQILVGGKPQKITSFSADNNPSTIVFLLDLSASQEELINQMVQTAKEIVKNSNPNNEYIVIAFNSKAQLILDKSQDNKAVEGAINKAFNYKAKGNTAFYNSIYLAIEKVNSGKYEKKIIISFGDGFDTQSQFYNLQDVLNSLKQSTALFYSISYSNDSKFTGSGLLTVLSDINGGVSFFPISAVESTQTTETIVLELKSQYRIGFTVSDVAKVNKWQDIKIKLEPSVFKDNKKNRKFYARTRSGIYLSSAK